MSNEVEVGEGLQADERLEVAVTQKISGRNHTAIARVAHQSRKRSKKSDLIKKVVVTSRNHGVPKNPDKDSAGVAPDRFGFREPIKKIHTIGEGIRRCGRGGNRFKVWQKYL